MLHNSGAYGPNETPLNANTPVNMSQVTAPLNSGRSLQNMGDITQQPLRGASGHYNLPNYPVYNHPSLDMRSNLSTFSNHHLKEYQNSYMPQNSTSMDNSRWQNGISPLNLNAQSTYVPNMQNFYTPYEKRPSKDTKTLDMKTALNIPESLPKTSNNDSYFYNTNQDMFLNYNNSYNQEISKEKIPLDITKRKSLENTVKLIENILINTTKEQNLEASPSKTEMDNIRTHSPSSEDISNDSREKTEDMFDNSKTIENIEHNTNDNSLDKEYNTKESDEKNEMDIKDDTDNENTKNEENQDIEDKSEIKSTLQHTTTEQTNRNSLTTNVTTPQEIKPKVVKELKIELEVEVEQSMKDGQNDDTDHQMIFCKDLSGMAKEDLPDEKNVICEDSINAAMEILKNGSISEQYYECPHCDLIFSHPKRFLIHTKWHTFGLTNEKRILLAREKERQKKQRKEAKIVDQLHRAIEEDGNTYPCKDCEKVFCSKGSLKNHRTRFHSGRVRECGICGAAVMGWAGLKAHAATHAAPYTCTICRKQFRHKHSLARHAETHIEEQEKTLPCKICGKLFAVASRLKEHQRCHARAERGAVFQCTYCAKAFVQSYSLVIHERTHRNEKPYSCDICNASYGTNSSLKRHLKVSHNRSKPFSCTQCGRYFINTRALSSHIARLHPEEGDSDAPRKKRRRGNAKSKDPQKLQKGTKSKRSKTEDEDKIEEVVS